MPLPVVQMTPQQIDEIHARIDAFKDAVRSGRPTPPLELISDEINALITSDPSLKAFKGKLYVAIEDGHFKGQLSVPLAQLGLAIDRKSTRLNSSHIPLSRMPSS